MTSRADPHQSAGRIRVTAELVDTTTGYNLWANAFDRQLEDIFTVRDEIATRVAAALHKKPVYQQRRNIKSLQTSNVRAYDFYLRGRRYFYDQFSPRGVEKALQFFHRAIDLDPQLFEARYMYGRVCFIQGKLEKAAGLFEEAHRLQPEDYQSALLAGQAYDDLGLTEKSVDARRRGVQSATGHLKLYPHDVRAWYMGANGLVALGEKAKGRQWLERALALEPEDSMLQYNAGCIYSLLDMKEEALDCLEKSVAGGLTQRGWYANDSNLDPIRKHPRFKKLLARLE